MTTEYYIGQIGNLYIESFYKSTKKMFLTPNKYQAQHLSHEEGILVKELVSLTSFIKVSVTVEEYITEVNND